jgi:hypothetical protein
MAASFKDLKLVVEKIDAYSGIEDLDKVFSEIISSESEDLIPCLKLVEDFLIHSLDSHKELKKVS